MGSNFRLAMKACLVTYVAATCVLFSSPVSGGAGTYTFTEIAVSPGVAFDGFPAINEKGEAAFISLQPNNVTAIQIGDGRTVTTVADTSIDSMFAPGGMNSEALPSINNRGAVVSWAVLKNGDEGLFIGDGRSITTVVQVPTTGQFIANSASINNSGTVAFANRLAIKTAKRGQA